MDKRNSGGRVATHDATTHTAIVLTLALVPGRDPDSCAAGSGCPQCERKVRERLPAHNQTRPGSRQREGPYPLHVRQGQER